MIYRTETVEKKVPVYVRPEPPEWLLAPAVDAGKSSEVFTTPGDPDSVLGVTRDGLSRFWQIVDGLKARNEAWRAWATANGESNE